MKKVKTIILSMLILCASAFMSACSCGGGDGGDINHVYETGITLSGTTTSGYIGEWDAESYTLTMACHKGDELTIRYKLSPDNATTTQVNWQFNKEGYIRSKNNISMLSQSTEESVTFVANQSSNGEEIVITFKTFTMGKIATARITVYEPKSQLSSFVAPNLLDKENTKFNINNGELSWKAVKQVISSSGVPTTTNGEGLVGYKVEITEKGGEPTTTEVIQPKIGGFVPGIEYSVRVMTLGDGKVAINSPYSDPIKFYQLNSPSDVSSNNGTISFTIPEKAESNKIFYKAGDISTFHPIDQNPGTKVKESYTNFKHQANLDSLSVYVKSYPVGLSYFDEKQGFAEKDGVRYYASVATDTTVIQKLREPVVTIADVNSELTIGGVTFTKDYLISSNNVIDPVVGTRLNFSFGPSVTYAENYKVKFAYKIVEGDKTQLSGLPKYELDKSSYIETTDSYIDISNYAPKQYSIRVYVVGNDGNTIDSNCVEMSFTKLGTVGNMTIVDNIIQTTDTSYPYSSVQLYFINESNTIHSKFVDMTNNALNIQDLNLSGGDYKIYARYIGKDSDTITGKLNTSPISIKVLSPVVSNQMDQNGIITIGKVTNADRYNLTLRCNNNTETRQTILALSDFVEDGGNLKISIYDVIAKIIYPNGTNETKEKVLQEVNRFIDENVGQLTYEIAPCGDGSNTIASANSEGVDFFRANKVNVAQVQLLDNIISFTAVKIDGANVNKYKIKVNGTTIKVNGSDELIIPAIDNIVTIDLNDDTKNLSKEINKYIDVNGNGANTIEILAVGRIGNSNNFCALNSYSVAVTFNATGSPIDLSLSEEQVLSWSPVVYSTDDNDWIADSSENTHKYTVKYRKSGETDYTTIKNPLVTDSDIHETNSVDVSSIIKANPGVLLEFVVNEIDSTKFTGPSSQGYYVMKLASTELTRVQNGETYTITWNAISGASKYMYDISDISDLTAITSVKSDEINTNSFNLDGFKNAGKYIFSVYAVGEETVNSADTPHYIAGDVGEDLLTSKSAITFQNVSAQRTLYSSGTTVTWDSVDGATYTFIYGSEDDEKVEIDTNSIDVKDILVAGVNSVKVETTSNFVLDGVRQIGTVSESSIIRLDTISDIKTVNGVLTFRVNKQYDHPDDTDGLNVDIVVLDKDGKEESIEKVGVTFETVEEEINADTKVKYKLYTLTLAGYDAGEIEMGIKLVSIDGDAQYIDGAVVTKKVTKLAAVTNVNKTGNLLSWTPVVNATSYTINIQASTSIDPITLAIADAGNKPTEGSHTGSTTFYYDETSGKYVYTLDTSIFTVSGEYNFTIAPTTTVTDYISGDYSSPATTVIKLKSKVDITVDGENIVIAEYDNSESSAANNAPVNYRVVIQRYTTQVVEKGTDPETGNPITEEEAVPVTGEKYDSGKLTYTGEISVNLNKVGLTSAGTYLVKVTYFGNGNDILDGEEYEYKDGLLKYETTSISTVDGELTWVSVDDETGYNIKFVDPENSGEENDIIIPLTDAKWVDGEIPTVEEGATPPPTFTPVPNKKYIAQVQVVGDENITSRWSEPFEFIKLNAPTELAVKTCDDNIVVGIDAEGNEIKITKKGTPVISWLESNPTFTCSNNYIISYNSAESEINNANLKMYPLALDLTGSQIVKIKVKGNSTTGTDSLGLLTSDYSSEYTVEYVSDVDKPKNSNGVISWDAVTGAYAYSVKVYIKSEYDNNPLTAEVKYTTYTSDTSFNIANININGDDYGNGYFTVVISALTDPSIAILSTSTEAKTNNTVVVYTPRQLNEFGIKDGRLTWSMNVVDINAFVEGQKDEGGAYTLALPEGEDTATDKVIKYVVNSVVNKRATEPNTKLESQISFIYTIKLNINGVENNVVADEVEHSGNKLTFYYDVSIEPEFKEDGATAVSQKTNSAGKDYKTGYYKIKIATTGIGDMAISNGAYTSTINAYKPTTPAGITTTTGDINAGYINFYLSAKKMGATVEYADTYEIKYSPKTSGVEGTLDILATGTNVVDGIKFSQKIVDMFKNKQGDGYIIPKDTSYRLAVRTLGTEVATWNETKGAYGYFDKDGNWITDLYLNSNSYDYTDYINILAETDLTIGVDPTTPYPEDSYGNDILWVNNNSSTATKLYMFGPFDVSRTYKNESQEDTLYSLLKGTSAPYSVIQPNSVDAETNLYYQDILGAINHLLYDEEYTGTWGEYKTELQFKQYAMDELYYAVEDNNRTTKLTLSDDSKYESGVYIVMAKEIGNKKGVVDSGICDPITICKLDKTSKVYESWLSNGKFTWNAVPYANAYRVEIYEVDATSTTEDTEDTGNTDTTPTELEPLYVDVHYPQYLSDTIITYEMRSGLQYNQEGKQYYAKIMATVEDNSGNPFPYFITGDGKKTDAYSRTAMPTDLQIDGTAIANWNDGVTHQYIEDFELRINEQLVYSVGSNAITTTILANKIKDGTLPKGILSVDVRATTGTNYGHIYISSSFSAKVEVINPADPVATIKEGVFNWAPADIEAMGGMPTTNQVKLITTSGTGENAQTNEQLIDTNNITDYDLYYELSAENYRDYTVDKDTYLGGNEYSYDMAVRYLGSEGYADSNTITSFYLETNYSELKGIQKLSIPTVSRADIIGEQSQNRVAWNFDEKASGYKVSIFENTTGNRIDFKIVPYSTSYGLYVSRTSGGVLAYDDVIAVNNDWTDSPFFSKDAVGTQNRKGYFTFSEDLLAELLTEGAVDVYVFIQAIGTMDSATSPLYISSGYSSCVAISTPPTPTDASYNATTGRISWKVSSSNVYNVVLKATYTLNNAYVNDFEDIPAEFTEIKDRKVVSTGNGNTIIITDTILLLSSDEGYNNKTPNFYDLRTIGVDYKFYITATTYKDINITKIGDDDGVSGTLSLEQADMNYLLFNWGDGSEAKPYVIVDANNLNNIRYRKTENYTIEDDIDMNDVSWTLVSGDFSGTIEGNDNTISNLTFETSKNVNADGTESIDWYSTMFYNVTGTISNININSTISTNGGSHYSLNASTIAFRNSGTMRDINITGAFNIETTTQTGISIGGAVVENNGTLDNIHVSMDILGLDTKVPAEADDDIVSTYVGGIVTTNHSIITNSSYSGELTGNYVGGIAASMGYLSSDNSGKTIASITNSYVAENAIIHSTNGGSSQDRTSIAGGLVGLVNSQKAGNTVEIKNAYSLATITVEGPANNNANTYIGALVGQILGGNIGATNTISNTYAKVNITISNPTNVTVRHLCVKNNNFTFTNNYYLVESVIGTNNITVGAGTEVNSLTELNNSVDSTIYNTSVDNYPTLKASN